MARLEKIARRALQWADVYRRIGDADGVAMAMQRWRDANDRMNAMSDAAFLPKLEIGGAE